MLERLEQMQATACNEIMEAESLPALEDLRVKFLGRKGLVTDILRGVSQAPVEERPALGKAANQVKGAIAKAIEDQKSQLEAQKSSKTGQDRHVDLSLPGRRPPTGHMHVTSQVIDTIVDIFSELGFQVATGPDIETEYYNFDSLNTPSTHPSRDLHDTFFVKPGVVLRTQTSPVQMRVMEKTPPPVAVVVPGRTYRVDADATHSPMFTQLEGLLVDEGVSFADLKGTVMHFLRKLFGPKTAVRFRPHYFPFTEPSAEIDVMWSADRGSGGAKWLEVAGCGMVHPEVFRHAKYDYEKYTGYAFGFGIERIAMALHGIDSISYFYENDLRFLEQF